jgi:hypothetical protein
MLSQPRRVVKKKLERRKNKIQINSKIASTLIFWVLGSPKPCFTVLHHNVIVMNMTNTAADEVLKGVGTRQLEALG